MRKICFMLCMMLLTAQGVLGQSNNIAEQYRKAAEQGDAEAQYNLAVCYYKGEGVTNDFEEAAKWYRKAAEQGHAGAQYELGLCYYNGKGGIINFNTAAKWYRKAAEQGHTKAQYSLAVCYYNGKGVNKDFAEAAKWLRKAAEQGHAGAQYNLGLCYAKGEGVEKDPSEAAKWLRKSAEQGNANAQYSLGLCYYNGEGVEKDLSEATKWFTEAAERGNATAAVAVEEVAAEQSNNADAQYRLGLLYYYGKEGVKKNQSKAVAWFTKAAEQGNADAQYSLGICYYNGDGVNIDQSKAATWFTKAAEQNNADAQYSLGICYYNGEGVDKDLSEAAEWFRKSAEQGNADAQYKLGSSYKYGEGVEKDLSKAEKWFTKARATATAAGYRKAAEQGNADAQYRLGICYYNGEGVEKDLSNAATWFTKAAEQGNADAQYRLGICYYNGEGVEKDLSKSVTWLTKARKRVNNTVAVAVYKEGAEQGNADAQYSLGLCYYYGEGVDKDPSEATKWFTEAAERGNATAATILQIITGSMNAQDVAAQKLEERTKTVSSNEGASANDKTHEIVTEHPKFPGGDAALMAWLQKNLHYPAEAQENGIAGRVMVSYVVDIDGSISDIKVLRGIHPLLDIEAVRVVASMPKWTPGKENGIPVRTKYSMPVTFHGDTEASTAATAALQTITYSINAEPTKEKEPVVHATSSNEGSSANDDEIHVIVEENPKFPGGDAALMAWLAKNLKYPKKAQKNGIVGRVMMSYVVDIDGSISDIKVIRGVHPLLDNEAMRLLASMPKWIPGKANGIPVRVKYNMPVTFRLE